MKLFIVDEHHCKQMPLGYQLNKWNTGKWALEKDKEFTRYDVKECRFCGCKLK